MSRGVWEAVEARTGKVGLGKIERRGSKGESRKEAGGKGEKKKIEERKGGRNQESGRGVGNLGQRRGSSIIRRGSKKDGSREVL